MRFVPPRFAPPQGLPLRESLTSREFVQNYITTRNSQRPSCDPSAEFYKTRWTEQPSFIWMGNQEPFEQSSVLQRSLDDQLAELAECVKQFVDSTPNTKPSAQIIEEQEGQLAYKFPENESDSYSTFYNRWTEHPTSMWVSNQQAFQQPCVPRKLSLEDQMAKLEESARLFMESTPKLQKINSTQQIGQFTYQLAEQENNFDSIFPTQPIANQQVSEECYVDQTLRWKKTNDRMDESEIEESQVDDPCPMEETTPDDPEISQEFVPTQVHTPHIPYQDGAKQPTKLQDCIDTDGLNGDARTKSESGNTYDQILHTINLDTEQATYTNVFYAVTVSAPAQPIALEEIHVEFYEKAYADPIIPPEPTATHVYVPPPKPFPQNLQEDMSVNMLGEVHTNLTSNMSHDQFSNTLIDLNTGQTIIDTVFVAELDIPAAQQARFYMGKKRQLNCSQILRPVQKLWVLNTRFKSVQRRRKPCWKGPYLISRTRSKKDLAMEFKCTVQITPYQLLTSDVVKEWIITREQVT